jgi:trehalose/maltose hydrolase-like predicted phosphorylase
LLITTRVPIENTCPSTSMLLRSEHNSTLDCRTQKLRNFLFQKYISKWWKHEVYLYNLTLHSFLILIISNNIEKITSDMKKKWNKSCLCVWQKVSQDTSSQESVKLTFWHLQRVIYEDTKSLG